MVAYSVSCSCCLLEIASALGEVNRFLRMRCSPSLITERALLAEWQINSEMYQRVCGHAPFLSRCAAVDAAETRKRRFGARR